MTILGNDHPSDSLEWLTEAAKKADSEAIRAWCLAGHNPNALLKGDLIINRLIREANEVAVKTLFHFVNPLLTCSRGWTPLMSASGGRSDAIFNAILEISSVQNDIPSLQKAMTVAASNHYPLGLRHIGCLLDSFDFETEGSGGRSPIMMALLLSPTREIRLECFKILWEKSDPLRQNPEGLMLKEEVLRIGATDIMQWWETMEKIISEKRELEKMFEDAYQSAMQDPMQDPMQDMGVDNGKGGSASRKQRDKSDATIAATASKKENHPVKSSQRSRL